MLNKQFLQKIGLATILFSFASLSVILSIKEGVAVGFLLYFLPLLLLGAYFLVQKPIVGFTFLIVLCFIILGLARYIPLPVPPGLTIDIVLALLFVILILHQILGKYPLGKVYFNPVLILSMVWMSYCFLEVFNPMTTLSNWSTSFRSIGMYIVLFQLLVFLLLNDIKRLRYFFFLWGVLVLLAAFKAIGQKIFGFDTSEMTWLREFGGRTHLIHSGIRYFSFYSDAANFGCNMGLTLVFFTILAINDRLRSRRIFYIAVALFAAYGMMISGTRAAIAVPFVGFATLLILVKEWKWIIVGGSILVLLFAFFGFTNIGEQNVDIRRMRTAFSFSKDASFNVRLQNQEKMKLFMPDYPFGIGMGQAKNAVEGDLMYGLPTDTSMVFIWVETGIVGLVFYLLIFASVLLYGIYYVWIVLQNPMIKAITMACVSGISGMLIAGYANEILHQLPTGPIVYIMMGIIMMCPFLDKQVQNA